jgi:hypothetical protein
MGCSWRYRSRNMFTRVPHRGQALFVIAVSFVAVMACTPGVFQKPVSDFKQAVETSRDVYFKQLKAKKTSDVEKFTVQRHLARSWTRKDDGSVLGMDKETADRIAEERSRPVIDSGSFAIRQRAFDIVIFYSDTLLALASNKDTDRLIAEVNDFREDTLSFIQRIDDIAEVGDVAQLAGPFGSAVKAFELISRTIVEAMREKAIRQSIVQADPMIQELFRTLGEEAVLAQATTRENYEVILNRLNSVIDKENFADNAAKDKIFDKYTELKSSLNKLDALGQDGDMRQLFEKARAAHSDLLRQASGVSIEELPKRIEEFRQRALLLKQAFDDIYS